MCSVTVLTPKIVGINEKFDTVTEEGRVFGVGKIGGSLKVVVPFSDEDEFIIVGMSEIGSRNKVVCLGRCIEGCMGLLLTEIVTVLSHW